MSSRKETVCSIVFHKGQLIFNLCDKNMITRSVDADGWPQGAVHLLMKVLEGRLADLQSEANDALSRTPKPRLKTHYPKKT